VLVKSPDFIDSFKAVQIKR